MKIIYDSFYKIYSIFNKNKFLQTLKQSFTMMLPILLIGSISLVLQSFPLDVVREFISSYYDGIIYRILNIIYMITFGLSSVYFLIILTNKYYKVLSKKYSIGVYACINAIICYFILVGPSIFFEQKSIFTYTNMNNIFVSILTAYASTTIFHFTLEKIYLKGRRISLSSSFNTAVGIVVPLTFSILFFTGISITIYLIFNINFNDFISYILVLPFEKLGSTYLGGLLLNFVSTLLFFFGIHGRSVFEKVYAEIFTVSNGGIASTSFFECFTLIGGVGSTLCLVVALVIFSNNRRKRRTAGAAGFPMIFNINELIIFGLPIMFNPIYIIPFVLVPAINYTIGYLFILGDVIPKIQATFQWTTPVFINGYLGTGTIEGSLIQLICFVVGVLVYLPFIKLDNKITDQFSVEMDEELKRYLIKCDMNVVEPNIFSLNNNLENHAENILFDLEYAIKKSQIDLFYQPLVKDGKIISVEGLLRFKHTENNYLFPPIIIQIAHEKGIFNDLSKEIVKRAIIDFKEMLLIKPDLSISINLDLDILFNKNFYEWFIDYVKKADLPKNQLGVEVTEQSKLSVSTNLNSLLEDLHDNGICVFMDDFSMGHTSIMFLQNASFDYVKLDGSLVKDLDNPRSKDIIKSIIKLGENLNFEVIAEYVETIEQKEELANMGCYLYQGYLYSKAIPFIQFIHKLREENK